MVAPVSVPAPMLATVYTRVPDPPLAHVAGWAIDMDRSGGAAETVVWLGGKVAVLETP